MSDEEKFEGLKQKWLNENERRYGARSGKIRRSRREKSNEKFMNLTEKKCPHAGDRPAHSGAAGACVRSGEDPAGETDAKLPCSTKSGCPIPGPAILPSPRGSRRDVSEDSGSPRIRQQSERLRRISVSSGHGVDSN
jgi:hypothetical protein